MPTDNNNTRPQNPEEDFDINAAESNIFEASNEAADGFDFANNKNPAIIKVIGVGGGGSNAVNYMYHQNIANVSYLVCNTDLQHLNKSDIPNRLCLGMEITKGNGAGNVPEVGRKCAEASADDIRAILNDGTEMVFITAGMGGGTGTGAAPVIAQIAKDAGLLTIGIITVPFLFEGELKIHKALEGADKMKEHVDSLLVINNENLLEVYPDFNMFNAFQKADDTLANAARSISEIISEEGYINVDFQDVRTTLKDSGTAIIATAYGEGEHRITNAIENALRSPLLKTHDIKTSRRLMLKVCASSKAEKVLRTDEFNEITDFTGRLPQNIDVKWGFVDDTSLGDKVKITILASGFAMTIRESMDDETGHGPISFGGENRKNQDAAQDSDQTKKKIEEVYGPDAMKKKNTTTAKVKYAVLSPEQFDNDDVILLLEKTPAFNRDQKFKEKLKSFSHPSHSPAPHKNTNESATGTLEISF